MASHLTREYIHSWNLTLGQGDILMKSPKAIRVSASNPGGAKPVKMVSVYSISIGDVPIIIYIYIL